MQRAAKLFVLLGIGSLFFRRGIIKPYTLQPFEFFILLAGITLALFFIFHKEKWEELKALSGWFLFFLAMALFAAAGTINGYRLYGLDETIQKAILIDFFYIAIGALAFFLVFYFSREARFRKHAVLTFLSPIIFTPFLLSRYLADKLGFTEGRTHFWGLTTNPSEFALLSLFSLSILVFLILKEKRTLIRVFLWILIVFLVALILWSGSRTAWASIVAVALFVGLFIFSKHYPKNWKSGIGRIFLYILVSILTVTASFFILPHREKIMVLDRVFPQITNYDPTFFRLDELALGDAMYSVIKSDAIQFPYQNRQRIWPQALHLALSHPLLGLGVTYDISSNKIRDGAEVVGAHNTFLEALLTGGVGLFLLLLLFYAKVLRQLETLERDYQFVGLVSMVTSIFLFSLFGDYLFALPWMWVPFALLFGKGGTEPSKL